MLESILNTIKKMLGLSIDDTSFDVDILVNINSAFMILNQLGVGPEEAFSIQDSSIEWPAYFLTDTIYEAVKTYIYLKVKLMFDPPTTSFHISAIERQVVELEWRLTNQVPIPPEVIP
jgi:hypothetical protein